MIKKINRVQVRTYTDNGAIVAYVDWTDHRQLSGTTEGSPTNAHMRALMQRAKREGVEIESQVW